MNLLLAMWQAEEAPPQDMMWNYILLAVLIIIAVALGVVVVKKRQKE
jgi:hypothetical protein